jgi:hypothetical protein
MLNSEPFREIDIWLETYQQIWKDKINSLDVYLKQLQNEAVMLKMRKTEMAMMKRSHLSKSGLSFLLMTCENSSFVQHLVPVK